MTHTLQQLDFPPKFANWQTGQESTVVDLSASTHRIKCLSAPTGSGKTAIAVAYALTNKLRFVYITKNLKLQTQISTDFDGRIADLRGRSHYACISTSTSATNCGHAPCLDGARCVHKHADCIYDVAFRHAVSQPWGFVTSYAKWGTLVQPIYGQFEPTALGQIDLLIIDEGHSIDSYLTDQCAVNINSQQLYELLDNKTRLPIGANNKMLTLWASNARQLAHDAYMTHKDYVTRQHIVDLSRQLARLSSTIHPWIVYKTTSDELSAKPLWPKAFVESYLMADIPNILIMSATLTEKSIKRLGIANYSYHYMDSNFDPARRPFYYLDREPYVKMNFHTTTQNKQKLYDRVGATLRSFKYHNTIIHSVSHARTRECCTMLRNVDHIDIHQSFDRFVDQTTPPSTLVHAGISEGVDLPGPMCRLNQLIKVPYAPLYDLLIKARRYNDPDYYPDLAAQTIMQQVGRSMRSSSDWSVSVIHDANFVNLLRNAYFEKWFLDTLETIDYIPHPLEL